MLSIVLKRTDFREADQLVTLYTSEHGKVEVLARGVKKMTSKNSMALEPFAVVEVDVVPGKEIDHLTTAHFVTTFPRIRADLRKLSFGSLALEITDSLTEVQAPDGRIFLLLTSYLEYLNASSSPAAFTLSAFVLQLLSYLGFTPTFDTCSVCNTPWATEPILFSFSDGGAVHARCVQANTQKPYRPTTRDEQNELRQLLVSDWLYLESQEEKNQTALGDLVYEFVLYQSGRALPDWRVLR